MLTKIPVRKGQKKLLVTIYNFGIKNPHNILGIWDRLNDKPFAKVNSKNKK